MKRSTQDILMFTWTQHRHIAHSKDTWGMRVLLAHHLPPFEGTKTCRQIQCWISLKAWPVFKGLHILVQLQ